CNNEGVAEGSRTAGDVEMICRRALIAGLLNFGMFCCHRPAAAVETMAVVATAAFPEARQPQIAVDPRGKVYVAFGAENSIYCAISDDGGKSYGKPSKVGDAGNMSLGMRRGPRVAATEKAVVVAAV